MALSWIDWTLIGVYAVFTVGIGLAFAKRAGTSVDEYFLSGRTLPWWLAGTSMVATTFAADTPLVVTGWVRDAGIWKNWLWWCFVATSMLGVFLFAPLWRRGGVMTKAELAELRYGGREAAILRGFLGVMHAGFTNTITLCWVLLAAAKIVDVLFGVDKGLALFVASPSGARVRHRSRTRGAVRYRPFLVRGIADGSRLLGRGGARGGRGGPQPATVVEARPAGANERPSVVTRPSLLD